MLAGSARLVLGLVVVTASMIFLFTVPRGYFAAATFLSTGCMIIVAVALNGIRTGTKPRYSSLLLGLLSAAILYLVFYLGGAAVDSLHPFGMTSASESSIYSLIASPSNPLLVQVAVLLFDSAGYEAFFRGVLQIRLQGKIGVAAAPAVALLDAGIHLFTLNPIWVGGTFITDLVWGLTCYYGKGTQGSFASHFIWDLAIFIIRPVT